MMGSQHNGSNGFHQTNQNVVIHLTPNRSPTSNSSVSVAPSPTSTSTPGINEGDDVLLKDRKDGLVYLGIAVEIDEASGMCLVRFGDGAERWGRLGKEVKSLGQGDEIDEDDDIEDAPDETESALVSNETSTGLEKANQGVKQSRGKRRPSLNSYQPVSRETPAHVLRARKELPYDFDSLLWDENHQRNDKERYCYCGESGDWYKKMLQCRKCLQWFHLECIRSTVVPRTMLLGDKFYDFVCTLCTGTCEEEVTRMDLNWADALHLTLFNLTVINNKKYHDLDTSILPFLKRRWKSLQGPGCILKMNRLETDFIASLLSSRTTRFRCGSESKNRSNYWGLCQVAPPGVPSTNGYYSATNQKGPKDVSNGGRVSGGSNMFSYSIKQQRRPAMKSSSDLNIKQDDNCLSFDNSTPSIIRPLKPLVIKLSPSPAIEHNNGLKNSSFKNSLLAIKEPYPYGHSARKHTNSFGNKAIKTDSSNNGSFLDNPVPVATSENQYDTSTRGLLGGYELNNGWRDFKAIMRKYNYKTFSGSKKSSGTLDTFIPPPKDFEGCNNPFRAYNQEPPILFPQTTLTSYDLLSNYSSRNNFHEMNRRQRRLFMQNRRHSFLSIRKNSITSSGDATPERDMDCSSSCSNSVDENVNGAPFLNPPPLLDFNEPLHLAPPSPPASSTVSKILDVAPQNEKSPPVLDLFHPPQPHNGTLGLPTDSDNVTSHNNNKTTNSSYTDLCSSSNDVKSIKHKSTTYLRDLKYPSSIKPFYADRQGANKYLVDSKNIQSKDKPLRPSINAKRLTLDGDIQYLFGSDDDRGTSNQENVDDDTSRIQVPSTEASEKQTTPSERNSTLTSRDIAMNEDSPEQSSLEVTKVKEEEKMDEERKVDHNIDLDHSSSISTELLLRNTANTATHSIIVLD